MAVLGIETSCDETAVAVYGGEGHDTLFGGAGNDALHGGTGNDQHTGGAGAAVDGRVPGERLFAPCPCPRRRNGRAPAEDRAVRAPSPPAAAAA